jgi:hypothetical protein
MPVSLPADNWREEAREALDAAHRLNLSLRARDADDLGWYAHARQPRGASWIVRLDCMAVGTGSVLHSFALTAVQAYGVASRLWDLPEAWSDEILGVLHEVIHDR